MKPDQEEAIRRLKREQLKDSESLVEWGESFVGDFGKRHDIKSLHPTPVEPINTVVETRYGIRGRSIVRG